MTSPSIESPTRQTSPVPVKQAICDVIQQGFYLLRFPEYLEDHFKNREQRAFKHHMRRNAIVGLSLFVLIGFITILQISAVDRVAFIGRYALAGICLFTIAAISTRPNALRFFRWYGSALCLMALLVILNSTLIVHDIDNRWAIYTAGVYATLVIYTLAQIRFYAATVACLSAGFIHLMSIGIYNAGIPLQEFLGYCFSANLIGMCIGYTMEHRQRAAFLSTLLLNIEKRDQEKLSKNLETLSRQDALTGLSNRRYFDERFAIEWGRCMRSGKPISVVLIDVDYFKQYNDHYGHQAGDDCLKQIANALLREASRNGELVGRYGGEEFIILYPDTNEEQVKISLQRMRQRIHDLHILHQGSLTNHEVTASMGAATTYPVKTLHRDKLVSAADQMLYKAKAEGRDCWFSTRISHCEPQPSQLEILP